MQNNSTGPESRTGTEISCGLLKAVRPVSRVSLPSQGPVLRVSAFGLVGDTAHQVHALQSGKGAKTLVSLSTSSAQPSAHPHSHPRNPRRNPCRTFHATLHTTPHNPPHNAPRPQPLPRVATPASSCPGRRVLGQGKDGVDGIQEALWFWRKGYAVPCPTACGSAQIPDHPYPEGVNMCRPPV